MRHVGLLAALLLLGSCAPLTARSPLFSPADAAGPAPLSEGLWMQADEECAPDARSEWADDCVSIEVSRARDGAWLYTSRSSGPDGEAEQYSWRFVIVPAVETARDDGYAPLYVAEYVSVDEPGRPLYAVVAPVGVMPAREVRMVGVIDCDDALREGPIPGVEEVHGDDEFERICVAGSRAAVRAAARPLRVGVAGARARPANTCRSALILTLQAAAASWTEERPRPSDPLRRRR